VIQVPGLPRLLIPHHLGLVVASACALLTGTFHIYGLWMCSAIATAAIRNAEWTARHFPGLLRMPGRNTTSLLYVVLEGVPPLLAFGHFFLRGWQGRALPAVVWWLGVGPAAATSLVALYVVLVALRRLLREWRRGASAAYA
jgi:hypothetical protein